MADASVIAVVGAGAWGTALANAAAATGGPVLLWARDAEALQRTRRSPHLPDVPLAQNVTVVANLAAIAEAHAVLLVVPAQATRMVAFSLADVLKPGTPVVTCAKGIEAGSQAFMTDVLEEACPACVPAILSGPSFADDVARGLPTAVTLAASRPDVAGQLAERLTTPTFRIYHATDRRGVEIGGAGKNVLAIGAGIVEGAGLGESAKAALIARGFSELSRFAQSCGGRAETLMGLSGLGDLVLTCASPKSRNHAFGFALGRGVPVAEAAGGRLAEGASTAPVLVAKARALGIEMPVSEAVDAVIAGRLSIAEATAQLMRRPVKAEI